MTVEIAFLCRDRDHTVPILSNAIPLASLGVPKRPQAFYDRSKPFLAS